jgi:hypothetical protein
MNSTSPDPRAVPHGVSVISRALTVLGFVGLVLTVILGFESPNTALLVTSAALTFAIPFALLWHLARTHTLTTAEKRMWMRDFISADAGSAMWEYMTSPDLRESARRRAEDAATRRTVKSKCDH